MEYYIELTDSRNETLKKMLEAEGLTVLEYTGEMKGEPSPKTLICAPNKKWNSESVSALPYGITVFCGKASDEIQKQFESKNIRYVNFLKNQQFAIKNANLTAEGVIALLISETKKSLFEQKILILGLGRCGKALAIHLGKLGLDYQVAAFRDEDFADSALYASKCYSSENFKSHLGEFDIIINNVPEKIISDEDILAIKKDAFVLEVASVNCLNAEKANHFKYMVAPGLPQKFSCESAAALMKEVVLEGKILAKKQKKKTLGFAITGSFCTYASILKEIQKLVENGYEIVPILSPVSASTDTRFGKASDFKTELKSITGREPLETLSAVEPLGPKGLIDALIIAPCTGNTLAKLANAVSDTPVNMAAKSLMRNEKPVIISISTNDALGLNLANIAKLIVAKNVFFVPFGQDDAKNKPKSLISDVSLIEETLLAAEKGTQLQPLLR